MRPGVRSKILNLSRNRYDLTAKGVQSVSANGPTPGSGQRPLVVTSQKGSSSVVGFNVQPYKWGMSPANRMRRRLTRGLAAVGVAILALVLLVTPTGSFRGIEIAGTTPSSPVSSHSDPSAVGPLMLAAAENSIASGHGPVGAGRATCAPTNSALGACGRRVAETSNPAAEPYAGWGNLTPYLSQSPSSRWGAAMVYDANVSDGYVVLFGGEGPDGALDDTWEFQSGTWTNVTSSLPTATNTPPPRYGAAMAYDSTDGYVVLFGGSSGPLTNSTGPLLNDTWEFLHGTWTQLCASCSPGVSEPSARVGSSASDDPSDEGVVLFGGLTIAAGTYTALNDTWLFKEGSWQRLFPVLSPTARYGAELTVIPPTGPVMLFGGCAEAPEGSGPACSQFLNDSWTFSAGVWTQVALLPGGPGARMGYGMASSTSEGLVLAFGGLAESKLLNETWEYSGGNWSDLTETLLSSPSPRDNVSLAYDPASGTNYFVLFGGWNATFLNETWVYPSPFSPLRVSVPVSNLTVTDVGRPFRVNVTIAGGAGHYNRTWLGLPPGCPSVNTSSLVCHPAEAGTYDISVRVRDAVGSIVWSASTAVLVNGRLTRVGIGPETGSSNTGIVPWNTTLIATWSGGTAPFEFSWNFEDGSANGSGNPVTHEFTAVGDFDVNLTVTDALGETSSARDRVSSAPPLSVEVGASPSSVELGAPVTFQVTAGGGFPPYSYLWSGLPSACAATDSPTISCSPQMAGSYDVSVQVTDQFGNNLSQSTMLIVRAPGPASTSSLLGWIVAGVVLGATAVLVAVWAVLRSRRARSKPLPNPPTPPVPPPRA